MDALSIEGLENEFLTVQVLPNDVGLRIKKRASKDYDIYDPEQLKAWLSANQTLVRIASSEDYPDLQVVKYSHHCLFKNKWDYAAIEMRGLVIDNDYNIVAHPLTKMSYPGEPLGDVPAVVLKDEDKIDCYRKVNGFMASVTITKNHGIVYSTTGTLDSKYAKLIPRYLPEEHVLDTQHHEYTCVYEIVDPDDPHIVVEEPGVTFLGMRAVYAGSPWIPNRNLLVATDTWANVKKMMHYSRLEGLVCRHNNGRWFKTKSRFYTIIKKFGRASPTMVSGFLGRPTRWIKEYGEDLSPFFAELCSPFYIKLLTTTEDGNQRVAYVRALLDKHYTKLLG